MRKIVQSLIAVAAAGIGLAVSPAMAVPTDTFAFTVSTSSSPECTATTPCGTITVQETTSTLLTINVNITPLFFAMTGAGNDAQVIFNVTGFSSSNATLNPATGWESSGAQSLTGGINSSFSFSTTCTTITGCKNGLTSLQGVQFTLTATSGNFDSCFTTGASCFLFVGDVGSTTGPCAGTTRAPCTGLVESNTCANGAVCTQGNPTPIPEPLTVSLFGAGLAGLGVVRRRKAKKSAGTIQAGP